MKRWLLVAPDLGIEPGPTYRPGGLQSMGRMIVRALAEQPWLRSLSVWSLADANAALKEALPLLLRGHAHAGLALSVRGFSGRRARLAAALLLRRRAFDHVMFVHVGVGSLAWLLPRGRHSLWQVGIDVWMPLRGARRRALEHARPLLSISHSTDARMRELNPWAPTARVVHLGLEPDEAWADAGPDAGAAVAHVESREPVALMVGRLSVADRYKGYDLVIAGWPQVLARVPAARLVVVGDGDDRGRLEDAARALPGDAGRRIAFLGRASHGDLREAYRTARLFVLPSTNEGFGLVHLEAMRAGLACIASRDAAAEIVVDGVTGYVVDPQPGAVAEAVGRLLEDGPLAARLGAAGRQRLATTFTYAAFRDRLVLALEDAAVAP